MNEPRAGTLGGTSGVGFLSFWLTPDNLWRSAGAFTSEGGSIQPLERFLALVRERRGVDVSPLLFEGAIHFRGMARRGSCNVILTGVTDAGTVSMRANGDPVFLDGEWVPALIGVDL